jgi:hypothetical protein
MNVMNHLKQYLRLFIVVLYLMSLLTGCTKKPAAVIYIDQDANKSEELAAREIRKYVYQRTGELLPVIVWNSSDRIKANAILVGSMSTGMMKSAGYSFPELGPDAFILKTIISSEGRKLLVNGGSSIGTLYAAYHLAEQMGVGFYLDGDVIPDKQIDFTFPEMDIKQTPLFSRRGIQPFHDFPEGPDWWNKEDYKAVFSQLPKLKMNFFGLHTYPEGGVGPEPLTWIGLPEDINPDGTVKSAYHSRHFTTFNGTWGYLQKKTSAYSFGTGQLFSRDDFGADYMMNRSPWPEPEDEVRLFDDMGIFLNDVFSFAKNLGIRTCLGTEIPLILPKKFIDLLKERGLDPESPDVRERIYEGIFTHIKMTHPLDFYWFWTPENWTWSGNNKKDLDNTIRDFNAAIKALKVVNPGFNLATCGWVLGPANDRALFDNYLPKNIAFSCINRNLGWEPVDSAFARINNREKWAIPWMEDDPGLTIPQFWVGRMRRDAADAYAYGCNGYFGIHWRTRELSMNVSALAKAAWEQPWNPEQGKVIAPEDLKDYLISMEGSDRKIRDMESLDFYIEWCRIQFGEEVSDQLATIFTSLDGVKEKTVNLQGEMSNLPRPANWTNGPGGIAELKYQWDSVKVKFNFIDEYEKIRPLVSGKGNLERFDFWLNQFKYLEAFEKLACSMNNYRIEAKNLEKLKEKEEKNITIEKLKTLVKQEAEELREIHKYLISSVTTWGGLGNITNWQQHNMPLQILPQIRQIVNITGDSLWVDGLFPDNIAEVSRIIVPSPQTMIRKGNDYTVKVICFNIKPETAGIYWRPLGKKEYQQADLKRISETYWMATIPSMSISGDFEYYIRIDDGKEYLFPASAPIINHAVVQN